MSAFTNATAIFTPVYLLWIKAHVGHPGNEKADELAKAGAKQEHIEHSASPRDITPLSFVISILKDHYI
jgi:ribonuclease HI